MPGAMTAFLSALCYSLSYLCVRRGQTDSDPVDHGLFPVLLVGSATLVLGLFLKVMANPAAPLVIGEKPKLSILFCVLAGIIGTCFGRMALYTAIALLGATRGVIIDMLSPIVTLTIAIIFLGESFHFFSLFGMVCIVLGMALLMVEGVWSQTRFVNRMYRSGVTVAMLAALFQGTGHVFRKPSILSPISPTFAATLDILSALALYVLLLLISGRLKWYIRYYVQHLNPYFIAAGCLSAAAALLFFSASSLIPVSEVSMIISIQPVIIALLSRILMKDLENLTWVAFTSSVLVTLGVFAITV